MPFDLAKVKAREVEINISFDDETLELAFYPNELTFELSEKLGAEGAGTDANLKALMKLISRWNITDVKGKTLPINEENLRQLPTLLLGRITQAIVEDMFPNAPTTRTPGSF